jgi:transcriptional regulator GlxA family with amidase domain
MRCTPNEHIVRTRLQEAAARVPETQDKVVTIAWQTGFTGPSRLIRAFRTHFRISPKRFRRRALPVREVPPPVGVSQVADGLRTV